MLSMKECYTHTRFPARNNTKISNLPADLWKMENLFPSLNFHTGFLHTLIDTRSTRMGGIIKKDIESSSGSLEDSISFFSSLNFHTCFRIC